MPKTYSINIEYRFRSKHSTIPNIHFIKKALDTKSHNILIKKLEAYGVRAIIIWNDYFSNYSNERTQHVEISGIKSKLKTIKFSIPHSLMLSPLLYLWPFIDMQCYEHGIFHLIAGALLYLHLWKPSIWCMYCADRYK